MLSLETESRLAKLLLLLSDEERAVETNRNILCSDRDFDCYAVFKFLDVEEKGYVNEFNIVSFLRNHSVFLSTQEARQIIAFYDCDLDGTLNYNEFMDLCISEADFTLKRVNRDRQLYDTPRRPNFLSYNVEYSFAKLLGRELDLVQRIDGVVRDLSFRFDFEAESLFNTLDKYNFGYVTRDAVSSFMTRNGYSLYETELKAIFTRVDLDKDDRITFLEFKRFLEQFCSYEGREKLNTGGLSKGGSTFRSTLSGSGGFRRTFSPTRTSGLINPVQKESSPTKVQEFRAL